MCVVKVPFRTCSGLERKPNRISNSLTDYRNFGSFLRTPLVHFVQMTQSSLKTTQSSYNATQSSYNLSSHIILSQPYIIYIISMSGPNAKMLNAHALIHPRLDMLNNKSMSIDETIGNREARARSQRTDPALDRRRIRVSDDWSDDSSSSDDDFTG